MENVINEDKEKENKEKGKKGGGKAGEQMVVGCRCLVKIRGDVKQ